MPRKAAALVQSMATNHGFADGNKRTTLILMHTLLLNSGYKLIPIADDVTADQMVEDMLLAVVRRDMSFDGLVGWFKLRLRRR